MISGLAFVGGRDMILSDVFLLYDSVVSNIERCETFSDAIIRLQRERGLSAPEVYHGAGIDAKHYSKIISDRNYQPKKETVFAFIIFFKLGLGEAEDLMIKAGFFFNPSSRYDSLIRNFVAEGLYDRKLIDEAMNELNLPLLPQKW